MSPKILNLRAAAAALLAVVWLGLAACASRADLPEGVDLKEAARVNMQLGVEYMRKQEMDLALIKLKRAVEQDPELVAAQSSIAYVYASTGQSAQAEKHYRKALALDPDDASVRNNFGVFLCGQGKITEAQRYFVEAATSKSYPTPEAAWTNAGVCARRQPDLEAAERYLREALKLNPKFPDALAQMAWITYQKKDYWRVRAFLQRYEAASQPTPETLWLGAMTERQLGDGDTARKYEMRLKREFPESEQAANLNTHSK